MKHIIAMLVSGVAVLGSPAAAQGLEPGAEVAFFGIHLIDTSTEGALNGLRPDEQARITLVTDYVAAQFTERGFTLVDLAPVQEEIDRTVNPAKCNNCEIRMASRLEADYAMTGEVQKVSNLILTLNLVVRDAQTGAKVRGRSVDIRGNTDDNWLRGFRYLIRNAIFPPEDGN